MTGKIAKELMFLKDKISSNFKETRLMRKILSKEICDQGKTRQNSSKTLDIEKNHSTQIIAERNDDNLKQNYIEKVINGEVDQASYFQNQKDKNIMQSKETLSAVFKKLKGATSHVVKNKKWSISLIGGCVILLIVAQVINTHIVYSVSMDGKEIGFVEEKNDVLSIVDLIEDKLDLAYGVDIVIEREKIQFDRTFASKAQLSSEDEILDKFTYMHDFKINGYEIKVNNQQVALLPTKEDAEKLLGDIKDVYVDQENEDIQYEQVYFYENVIIDEVSSELNELDNYEQVFKYILKGTNETKIHKVKKGENYWTIAERYKIKASDLEKANPNVNPDLLQIGQNISLLVPKPLMTVVSLEKVNYTEKIPFEIGYEDTSALFKGEKQIRIKGAAGTKEIVAQLEKRNGIEISRQELTSTITKEPKKQVVLLGSKALPLLIGTGTFDNPTRGTLTSKFGWRWGRKHSGIDIGAKTGTTTRAADGGVVTFAGWKGDYGLVVIIDHGGNKSTLYAHSSKLLVSKGAKVYKGQKIAEIGNTGRSTGPHLHFEVRINNVPQNPLTYVNY